MLYFGMRVVKIYTAFGIPPGKSSKILLFNAVDEGLAQRGLKHFSDHTKVTLKSSDLFLADTDDDIPEMSDFMRGHKLVNGMTEEERASVKRYLAKADQQD